MNSVSSVTPLNSNLILLIQIQPIISLCILRPFKFQSDSINTKNRTAAPMGTKITLNSNLILLILRGVITMRIQHVNSFKFQSDSINTMSSAGT